MDYFDVGDVISTSDLNAVTYLLRKFKRLNEGLKLGSLQLESNYGTFNFDKSLTSVGGNFVIESDVTVSSSDCLRNCFYSFVFGVIDVNTSGTVNKRSVRVTGGTGEHGQLSITLPVGLIESDEVILPDFNVDIVFDEHEYYTPVAGLNVDLSVDKLYVLTGETATITATVTDETGEPVENLSLQFNVNDILYTETTDSDGVVEYNYTGVGAGMVNVTVSGQTINFYDGQPLILKYTGNTIVLGHTINWVSTDGDVVIDWGDGTTTTVNNPYNTRLTHNYTDGELEHNIIFIGTVTKIRTLFYKNNGVTSVSLPDTITSLLNSFYECNNIVDYQLYWMDDAILPYDRYNMPVNSNTVFTIPNGETNNYISEGYPSDKLLERRYYLTITGEEFVTTDETISLTALLTDTGVPVAGETLSYVIKQGDTVIDSGSDVTDSNGEIEIEYTGTSIGKLTLTVTYDTITQKYSIYDAIFYDKATNTSYNTDWENYDNRLTITRDNIGTIISNTNTNNGYFIATRTPPTEFIAEFEIININGSVGFAYTSSNADRIRLDTRATAGDKVRIEYNNGENKVYINNTLKATVTTSTLSYVAFRLVQSASLKFKNFVLYNMGEVPAHDYSVSLTTDKSAVTFGESVVLSGSLLDDGVPVDGVNVALYDGATSLGTVSTDSDGEFIKTLTNLSVGSHSLKAVYSDVESSIVSVTVSKISTSTSITASSSSILTTDTLLLSGSVSNVSSGSVKIYEGSTLVDEVSLSSGSYSKSLTGLSVGTHTYKAVYDGDSTHDGSESSTVTVTVSEPAPVHDYSLSVVSDKDILSYADGESATITATLTDNGSGASGETLSYTVKHGQTVIDSGSDTTDSNGQISFNYTSTGIGDVDIIVDFGILLQERYELLDLDYYNKGNKTNLINTDGATVTSDGEVLTVSKNTSGEVYVFYPLELRNTDHWTYEFTYVQSKSSYGSSDRPVAIQIGNNNYISYYPSSRNFGGSIINTLTNQDLNVGDVFKCEYDGTSFKFYINDVLKSTKTASLESTFSVGHYTNNGLICKMKDIKIKVL